MREGGMREKESELKEMGKTEEAEEIKRGCERKG